MVNNYGGNDEFSKFLKVKIKKTKKKKDLSNLIATHTKMDLRPLDISSKNIHLYQTQVN